MESVIEHHPLKPFLPPNAKILMLGSFPPKRERWSMDFFYPNFNNDMWRILGMVFYNDKNYFADTYNKKYSRDKAVAFCEKYGVALHDTAVSVIRLRDNASDKYLQVVDTTDISKILEQIQSCEAVATTGQKATDIIVDMFKCEEPKVGKRTVIEINGKRFYFYKMPSSSRAYPVSLENKADKYRVMFKELAMIGVNTATAL